MRIIKQGKIPEEVEVKFTCLRCSTVLMAKVDECRKESSFRNESFLIVNCPVCKVDIASWTEI